MNSENLQAPGIASLLDDQLADQRLIFDKRPAILVWYIYWWSPWNGRVWWWPTFPEFIQIARSLSGIMYLYVSIVFMLFTGLVRVCRSREMNIWKAVRENGNVQLNLESAQNLILVGWLVNCHRSGRPASQQPFPFTVSVMRKCILSFSLLELCYHFYYYYCYCCCRLLHIFAALFVGREKCSLHCVLADWVWTDYSSNAVNRWSQFNTTQHNTVFACTNGRDRGSFMICFEASLRISVVA